MRGDSLLYSELLRLSDDRLMQEVCAGNDDAFAVVFKRYHHLVQTVALRILRDAAEAEDMTQAVFLEIFRNAARFDYQRGSLKVWLLQYAYTRSMNRRNYLLVRHAYDTKEVSTMDEAERFWFPERLQLQEASHLSSEAMACLTDSQRQTITMVFFEGLTCREIAVRTGDTYANIRHHYYRGLDQMRSYLNLLTSRKTRLRKEEDLSL